MPLIYGEGKKSFVRLQSAILDQEEDYSILAWSCLDEVVKSPVGLLAASPTAFATGSCQDPRKLPCVPNVPQHRSLSTRFVRRWMPKLLAPGISVESYYSHIVNTDYDSLQSYISSGADSETGEKLPDCISIKTPRVPVRATSRGLHVSLPVRTLLALEVQSIAWTYCLYQNRLLCILLQSVSGSQIFARRSPACLVLVDARYLKDFEMREIYCHTCGPVSPIGPVVGTAQAFHRALTDLARTEKAAGLSRPSPKSNNEKSPAERIQAIVGELRHTDPSNINIRSRIEVGWLDEVKIRLEDWTTGSWNWAPLQPPRRPCTEHLWHIEWKCVCGEKKWDQAPSSFARGILQLLSQTQMKQKHNRVVPYENDPLPVFYVFLLVNTGKALKVSEIAVEESDPASVLDNLQTEYLKSRGRIRTVLGFWRLSHFEYVKFERILPKIYVVVERHVAPEANNDQYRYTPRPGHQPLISRHEFQVLLRARLHGRSLRSTVDVLSAIPKRTSRLDDGGNIFWGLEAREEISFLYILSFHVFLITVPFIFWSYWISKHPGDLQNASVPLLTVLALISTWWTLQN